MNTQQKLGRSGERFAREVLENDGYLIIACNYTCKLGEIDIIAKKNDWLHFVEVKTRRSFIYGRPTEAINTAKKNKIRKVAEWFLRQYKGSYNGISFDAFVIEASYMENCM